MMNTKAYIKFGDIALNLRTINSISISRKEMKVTIEMGSKSHVFKFKDDKDMERFSKYLNLFSNEFDVEMVKETESPKPEKQILT